MFALAVTSGSFNPVVSGTAASIVMNNSVAAEDAFAMAMIGATTLPTFVIAIMTENRTTTIVPTSMFLPSEYCLMPNQNAIAKVPYCPIIMGDITRPMRGAALASLVAALSNKASCNLANFASAPNAATMRMDENISKAIAEASS